MNLKKNDIIEISITDITREGLGIGRYDGFALFVKDALPGDSVRAVVTKLCRSHGYAKTVEILKPSVGRVKPPCPLAKKCGGCQLMELSYKDQLALKENQVKNTLLRIGKDCVGQPEFEPIAAMTDKDTSTAQQNYYQGTFTPLHYRNKIQFPAGKSKDNRPVFGFYAERTHYIIETTSCPAAFDGADQILEAVHKFTLEYKIPIYDEKTGTGLLRHVLMRKGFNTGQIMVCLVINGSSLSSGSAHCGNTKKRSRHGGASSLNRALITALTAAVPGITSICLNINRKNTNVIMGDETVTIYGSSFIEEKLFSLTFRISALSFFQVNSIQTEKLYAKALEYAALSGNETVWDLYCGTGTISLFLAQKAKKVYGVEIIEQAIENARANAALNNIENVEFFCGKSEEIFPEFYKNSSESADVVVLDPPRKGCDQSLLETILSVGPQRIVYISCNPATLARDMKILGTGYDPVRVMPCDMFPHTCHVETVTLLQRSIKKPDTYVNVSLDMDDFHRIIGDEQKTSDPGI